MIITPSVTKKNIIKPNKNILLSYESFIPNPSESRKMFKIVNEKEKIIISPLAHLDKISRNRCMYPKEDFLMSLKSSKYVTECLQNGGLLFEDGHPARGVSIERFLKIDSDRVAGRILKYWVEGDFVMGVAQFLPPRGDIIWEYIMKGMNKGFSLRTYTPNYEKCQDENGPYIKKKAPMYHVTWDCIDLPGFESCRFADPALFAANNPYWLSNGKPETFDSSSTEALFISQNWIIDDPITEYENIKDTVSSESLLTELSEAVTTQPKKEKIKRQKQTYNHSLTLNTRIFHEVMNTIK